MIIACVNHKGGVGKTTTSQNLAVHYARKGAKVCIVDTDGSENDLVWWEDRGKDLPTITVYALRRANTIRKFIKKLYEEDNFEVVIIDGCPNDLTRITEETLGISHIALIPVRPESKSDIVATELMANKVKDVEETEDRKIPAFFLLTQVQEQLTIQREFMAGIEEHSKVYNIPIMKTKLHRRTAFGRANSESMGVQELSGRYSDKQSSDEVEALAQEIESIFDTL